ncbi:hypothetical protein LTR66_016656 [Elasticomyces elasticus]|nr:hypothetical protein LTR66_016656 [Elasticomyces elasticus]
MASMGVDVQAQMNGEMSADAISQMSLNKKPVPSGSSFGAAAATAEASGDVDGLESALPSFAAAAAPKSDKQRSKAPRSETRTFPKVIPALPVRISTMLGTPGIDCLRFENATASRAVLDSKIRVNIGALDQDPMTELVVEYDCNFKPTTAEQNAKYKNMTSEPEAESLGTISSIY